MARREIRKPSAGIVGAPTLHDYGTVTTAQTIDPSTADVHVMTLGANLAITLSTFTVPDRTVIRLFETQDATGSRLVTSWTGVTWLNGVTPTLRTTASAYDLFEFTYVSSLNTWVGRYLTLYTVTFPGDVTVGEATASHTLAIIGKSGGFSNLAYYSGATAMWYCGRGVGDNSDYYEIYDVTGAVLAFALSPGGGNASFGGTVNVQGASGLAIGAVAGRRRLKSTGAESFNLLGDSNALASLDVLILAAGNTPATAGEFRLPSQGTLQARNSGNSANVQLLTLDSADEVRVGQTGNPVNLAARAHTLAGSSGTFAQIGGQTFQHFADAGNSGTGETDLYSDSIAASTLSTNGDRITVVYGGTMVSSATATRQIRVYFGGTLIFDSGTLSLGANTDWAMDIELVRVSSSVVRAIARMNTNSAALVAYAKYTEVTGLTLSNTNTLKVTGQAAGVGAASNDIVAKLGTVEWGAAA